MGLDASILADGFLDLQENPPENEAAAIAAMAGILVAYFKTAEATPADPLPGIPINALSVDGQLATVTGALAGLKTSGPTAIQAACTAFWTAVVDAVPSFFSGCTTPAVLSTSLATMAAAMFDEAATTISDELPPADATQALADAIHTAHTITPTTVTFTGPPSSVIPVA